FSGFNGASPPMNFSKRVTENGLSPSDLTDDEVDHLRTELAKMEEEIQTLRQVLLVKEKYAADVRRQLGMSPFSSIKQNLSKGWHEVQTSSPYVRTRETVSHAGQATSSALSNMGVAVVCLFVSVFNQTFVCTL
uniref:Uncharacterized protein n=1 Tax=Mola mola TaxID=94237 RepID=A0A3Q3WRT9_MOLML